MKIIDGGVTAAKGFKAAAAAAEIKYKGRTDMAMVYSEVPCVAAGTFTTNVVKAAPVKWDQDIVYNHPSAQVVICNSGIANACTGAEGYGYCKETADAAAEILGVAADSVLVASTGVIGMQVPIDRIKNGVKMMAPKLDGSLEAGTEAAKAIMTTDTKKKEVAVQIEIGGKTVTVGGMCKGSGMIHPNMCTMLGFVTTDAKISKKMLQEALSEDVKDTYNMVSVDGDTSTNDTVLLLANGLAENPEITEKGEDYETFKAALNYINTTLAKKIAGDGEGATALFEVKIIGAESKEQAVTYDRAYCSLSIIIYNCRIFHRHLCTFRKLIYNRHTRNLFSCFHIHRNKIYRILIICKHNQIFCQRRGTSSSPCKTATCRPIAFFAFLGTHTFIGSFPDFFHTIIRLEQITLQICQNDRTLLRCRNTILCTLSRFQFIYKHCI